jgi:capsular exopolysaccharide synthesis family protein
VSHAPLANPPSDELGGGIDVTVYLRLVLKRWPWIAAAMVVCTAIGVGKYFVSPKLYRATTQIQIEPRSLVPVSQDSNPWLEQWTNMKYFPTQYRLLRSRGLAYRVIDDLRLDTDSAFGRPPRGGGDEAASAEADASYRAGLANRLLGGLTVDPIEGTELLNITYVGTDGRRAANIANAFAQAFIRWGIDSRYETLNQVNIVLGQQIEGLRAEIEELEIRIQDFGRESEVMSTDPASGAATLELMRLNEQYSAAVTDAIGRQQRHRELVAAADSAVAERYPKASLRNLESDLLNYEREYQSRLQTLKPDHPGMVELTAQVQRTRQRYDEELAEHARNIRSTAYDDWQSARRLIESLDRQRSQVQRDSLSLNVDVLPLANMQMELNAKRVRLSELVERQSQADLSSSNQLETRSNVHIIDEALVPQRPFRPSLRQNVGIGTGLGLLLGVGVVLLFNFLDRTIKSAEELQRLVGLPVLAVIPDMSVDGQSYGYRSSYGSRTKRKSAAAREGVEEIELLPEHHPRLAVSEAYRSFRTALLLSSAEELKFVTITSAEAGEGKTATSTNLAVVMAQLGKKVLLIDGDLRKPRLHRVFGLENRSGLVNCLAAGEHPDNVIQKTQVPGLNLLTSGPHPPNPSELLASDRMRQFADWARKNFDFVVVDSPPVLAVSDAILPSALSDGVILCFHSNRIVREDARSCVKQVQMAGIKVLGLVLNRYRPGSVGHYDRRYRYYEAYAESADSAA